MWLYLWSWPGYQNLGADQKRSIPPRQGPRLTLGVGLGTWQHPTLWWFQPILCTLGAFLTVTTCATGQLDNQCWQEIPWNSNNLYTSYASYKHYKNLGLPSLLHDIQSIPDHQIFKKKCWSKFLNIQNMWLNCAKGQRVKNPIKSRGCVIKRQSQWQSINHLRNT